MQIDVDGIEKDCNELWSLVTELRELAVTAKSSAVFKLTTDQERAVKKEFLSIIKRTQDKAKKTASRVK